MKFKIVSLFSLISFFVASSVYAVIPTATPGFGEAHLSIPPSSVSASKSASKGDRAIDNKPLQPSSSPTSTPATSSLVTPSVMTGTPNQGTVNNPAD